MRVLEHFSSDDHLGPNCKVRRVVRAPLSLCSGGCPSRSRDNTNSVYGGSDTAEDNCALIEWQNGGIERGTRTKWNQTKCCLTYKSVFSSSRINTQGRHGGGAEYPRPEQGEGPMTAHDSAKRFSPPSCSQSTTWRQGSNCIFDSRGPQFTAAALSTRHTYMLYLLQNTFCSLWVHTFLWSSLTSFQFIADILWHIVRTISFQPGHQAKRLAAPSSVLRHRLRVSYSANSLHLQSIFSCI